MAIAVIGGTGAEGMGLALRWTRAGEEIIIGSRDETKARDVAGQISAQIGTGAQVRGATNEEAVAQAQVVVLTVPFGGHAGLCSRNCGRPFLSGSVLQLIPVFRSRRQLADFQHGRFGVCGKAPLRSRLRNWSLSMFGLPPRFRMFPRAS